MTLRQFSKKTGWPIEELHSMPVYSVYLPLIGIYSMGIEFVDMKTGKSTGWFTDFSWRDNPEGP